MEPVRPVEVYCARVMLAKAARKKRFVCMFGFFGNVVVRKWY